MQFGTQYRRSLLYAIATLACASLPGAGMLRGNDFAVQGSYSVHAIIGPNVGSSIGIFNVDSNGTLSGQAMLNIPAPDGKTRVLIAVTVSGTVTVNPDGSGQAKYDAKLPDGTINSVIEDFVITKGWRRGHTTLALKLFEQREQASVLVGNGYEVIVEWDRLPDDRNR